MLDMILTDVGDPQVEYWGEITTHKQFGVEDNGIVLVKSSCVAQLTHLIKRLSLDYFLPAYDFVLSRILITEARSSCFLAVMVGESSCLLG